MLKHLCCDSPSRRTRFAWVSFQPNGDISVGMFDKTYIAPQFKARHFVWSAYNRRRISYVVPSDPGALEPVRNPHFTYHAQQSWFHLKPSKKQDGQSLFEAIADVPLALQQRSYMPWIRATTSPISQMPSGGKRSGPIPADELVMRTSMEQLSVKLAIDFVRPNSCSDVGAGWDWSYTWEAVGLRISTSITHPQIATLAWFHEY